MTKNLFETGTEPKEQVQQKPVNQEIENQEPNNEQEDFGTWDKEKSVNAYKNLQRKITEREVAYKQEMEERIRAEERARLLEEMVNKKPEEPKQQAPVRPSRPQKPNGYNRADAIAYPDSDSGRYEEALQEYYDNKEQYDEWEKGQLYAQVQNVTKTFEERKNEELRTREFAERKAAQIARLSKATNGDIHKASKVFDFVQDAMGKDDPSWFVKLYDASVGNVQSNLKAQQADLRGERQNYIPPGALVQNNYNNKESNEPEQFMKEIGRRSNKHDLFKTVKN